MRRDFAYGLIFGLILIWLLTRPDTPRADTLRAAPPPLKFVREA